MVRDGQVDNVVASGHEGRVFESSHLRPTFPIGSPLLAVAPCRKSEEQCYFTNKVSKKIEDTISPLFL